MISKKKKTKINKKTTKMAKARKPKKSIDLQLETVEQENIQTASIEEFNSSVDMSFFYTNDKQLNAIDDAEIILKITARYPAFVQTSKDTLLRKTFLEFLDNKNLINDILDYYSITIMDLFKVIYKQYSALFNTLFIKKVKDKIKSNGYFNF